MAGSKNVLELHGSIYRTYCKSCDKEFGPESIFENKAEIPLCDCSKMIRPRVVLYGEKLDEKVYLKAQREIETADMLIIAGTSLSVNPAALLVSEFKGKYLVVINNEKPKNVFYDLLFTENMKEVFEKIKC